jgi:hypothetical protein
MPCVQSTSRLRYRSHQLIALIEAQCGLSMMDELSQHPKPNEVKGSPGLAARIAIGFALVIGGVLMLYAIALLGEPPDAADLAAEDVLPESWRYELDDLKRIDDSHVGYTLLDRWPTRLTRSAVIAAVPGGGVAVAGESAIGFFDSSGQMLRQLPLTDVAEPTALAFEIDGSLWLAQRGEMLSIDQEGRVIDRWPSAGPRSVITAICVAGDSIYLADAGRRLILRLDRSGNRIAELAGRDEQRGIPGLVVPSPYLDLAMDSDGHLWITNPGRHQLESYRPDGSLVSSWGKPSVDLPGFCGCCNPAHFALLADGSFITAEKGIRRVKKYDPTGTFECVVLAPSMLADIPAEESRDLMRPARSVLDVAVDREQVYVLDPLAGEVLVLQDQVDR